MRIQHNIAALNSYRQLNGNNNALSKNLEKLSSGYRINRAGDDAAGLAISEKMRAQIKGLEAAQKNANDGISLVQTAEGALTEVHSMLNRMTYLATQSANGTYDDTVDRNNLQKEVTSLLSEIDRVSEATNFNGINLLDGSLGGPKVTTEAGQKTMKAAAALTVAAPTVDAGGTSDGGAAAKAKATLEFKEITFEEGLEGGKAKFTISGKDYEIDVVASAGEKTKMKAEDVAAAVAAKIGKTATVGAGAAEGKANVTVAGAKITFESTTMSTQQDWSTTALVVAGASAADGKIPDDTQSTHTKKTLDFDGRIGEDMIGGTITIGDQKYEFVEDGGTAKDDKATAISIKKDATAKDIATAVRAAAAAIADTTGGNTVNWTAAAANGADDTKVVYEADKFGAQDISMKFSGFGVNLQVGDTNDKFNKVKVSVDSMSSESLGIDKIDISTQTGASDAIKKIKDAINSVSSTRGDLGAVQNRLEHTINNLGVTTENITAAESRIRDTDMADEMMAYTKNNILVQAAQAMLAQANQVPQGVLQLLQ